MPESPKQPNWEDISFEDIDALVAAGNVPQALFLAKVRLEAISRVMTEIQLNNGEGEIPLENWQAMYADFAEEAQPLKQFINFHERNPKYRQ
jgi:uncharacterized protein YhfF